MIIGNKISNEVVHGYNPMITRQIESIFDSNCESIGSYAFTYFNSLKTVNFQNCSVIGSYAFASCGLISAELSFPNCVSIYTGAFQSNYRLSSANFPKCTNISVNGFATCRLTYLSFPECISISSNAFNYISSGAFVNLAKFSENFTLSSFSRIFSSVVGTIKEAVLGECAYYISSVPAFKKIESLTTTASLVVQSNFRSMFSLTYFKGENCKAIEYSAFQSNNIVSVIFPECVSISAKAFQNCTRLSDISFPKCKDISANAFESCTALININFPECLSVDRSAFGNCASLLTASFPKCKSIMTYAFTWCTSLESIDISACKYIADSAFYGCNVLSGVDLLFCSFIGLSAFKALDFFDAVSLSVNLLGSSLCDLGSAASYIFDLSRTTIYVPSSLYEAYISHSRWATASSRIVSV